MNENEFNFNFDDVEDFKGRIEPGIEECQIVGVTQEVNSNGKPYIEMSFITSDGEREHKERFYISSEKASKMTVLRLKHIVKVLKSEEEAKGKYNLEKLNSILTGLKGRFLFLGEEYLYNDELRVRTNLAFLNFVEPLTIPKEESKLKYDPNNRNHLKRLPKEVVEHFNTEIESEIAGAGEVSEELF